MNRPLLLTQAPLPPGVPGPPGLAAVEPAMEVHAPGPAHAMEAPTAPGATSKLISATPTPALVIKTHHRNPIPYWFKVNYTSIRWFAFPNCISMSSQLF